MSFALIDWLILGQTTLVVLLPIHVITLTLSMAALLGRRDTLPSREGYSSDTLPDLAYIQPFGFLVMWLVVTYGVLAVSE